LNAIKLVKRNILFLIKKGEISFVLILFVYDVAEPNAEHHAPTRRIYDWYNREDEYPRRDGDDRYHRYPGWHKSVIAFPRSPH
jgi:hypothetical protein